MPQALRRRRQAQRALSRPSPLLLVAFVLSFTLMFWVIVWQTTSGRALVEIHRLWASPGYAGFSLFTVSTFIVLLLLYLLATESILARHQGDSKPVVLCLLCILPIAAVGAFLVEVSHVPTYFYLWEANWYDEPFDERGWHLGRVVSTDDDGPTRLYQVALDGGRKVMVSAVPRHAGHPESGYVAVQEFSGRYTHTLCHRLEHYLPRGHLDMLTERGLDALE